MTFIKRVYKFIKNKVLRKAYIAGSDWILCFCDWFVDLRVCGRSLVRTVPSIYEDEKNGIGGTTTHSTHYVFLKRIFSHVTLDPSDMLLDVGCGKGRVLAFLLKQKYMCTLYGIEHNTEVGKIAVDWTKRYPQVNIIVGDAFQLDYNAYTVLTLARSFHPVTYELFVKQLEETMRHPIRLVSWYDQGSMRFMRDRPGWRLDYHEIVNRIHGLKVAFCPQSFSIWTYNPCERKQQEAISK